MANLETFDALLEVKVSAVGGVQVLGNNATSTGDVLDLQVGPFSSWNDSNKNTLECVFVFTAITLGGGTITISFEIDSAVGMGSAVTAVSQNVPAIGRQILILDLATATKLKASVRYIRTKVVMAGATAGSYSYRAYFRKPRGLVGG